MHTLQCKVFSLHGKFTQKSRAVVSDATTSRNTLPSKESGICQYQVQGPPLVSFHLTAHRRKSRLAGSNYIRPDYTGLEHFLGKKIP